MAKMKQLTNLAALIVLFASLTAVRAVSFQQDLSSCRKVYSYIDANPVELNTTSGFRLQITDKRWAGGPILVERNFTWPPQPSADETLNLNRSTFPTPAWARTTGELVPRISSDNTLVQLLRFNLTPYWNSTGWRVPGGQGYLTAQLQLDLLDVNNTQLAYYPNTQQRISAVDTGFFYCRGLGAATEKDDDGDSGGSELRPGFKAIIAVGSAIGFSILLCIIVRIRNNIKNRQTLEELSRKDLEKQSAVDRFRTTPTVWHETPVTLDPGPSPLRRQGLARGPPATAAPIAPLPTRTNDWRSGGMVLNPSTDAASPSAVPPGSLDQDFDQLALFVRRAEEQGNAERLLDADARRIVRAPSREGARDAEGRLPGDAMNGDSNPPPAYTASPQFDQNADRDNASRPS
ncbi:hypothetical protein CBOM_06485 [Ceraceosorus bombacis]|uniref:Uncharacterized protein n=1 Tax=Ceraceosorus bombacis TaxID=401625 RepID=A0A0P1BK74_9BASI|nr:hypothetical protein CBOM_06485 [Ceraceosorus bombacis]